MSSNLNKPPVPINGYRRFCFYWLPLILFCAAIFFQSALPSLSGPPLFPHDDKVMHLGAYAVMAFLFARALNQQHPKISRTALKWSAIGFAGFYGLTDEIHQFFVPGRDASLWDFMADILGSALGARSYLIFFWSKS